VNASATLSLRFCPPDRVPAAASSFSASPTSVAAASASAPRSSLQAGRQAGRRDRWQVWGPGLLLRATRVGAAASEAARVDSPLFQARLLLSLVAGLPCLLCLLRHLWLAWCIP
jgi:hypothetical protein